MATDWHDLGDGDLYDMIHGALRCSRRMAADLVAMRNDEVGERLITELLDDD